MGAIQHPSKGPSPSKACKRAQSWLRKYQEFIEELSRWKLLDISALELAGNCPSRAAGKVAHREVLVAGHWRNCECGRSLQSRKPNPFLLQCHTAALLTACRLAKATERAQIHCHRASNAGFRAKHICTKASCCC